MRADVTVGTTTTAFREHISTRGSRIALNAFGGLCDTLARMNDEDRARAERAQKRAGTMSLRLLPRHPGREPDFSPVSGAEAVALAVELSRMAWTLAGRSLPSYRREEIPIRLSRRAPP